MATFTKQEVINYYHHTQSHMRMFWHLDESMGLHYGIWDANTKNHAQAIINTNRQLALLGEIKKEHNVLDAGCGVGGSSIFIAKNIGAQCLGITLSKRQVATATKYAEKNGISQLVRFEEKDYTNTGYADNSFDRAWALESMSTAPDKFAMFKEMYRVLKPGGRFLLGDWCKPFPYNVDDHKCMQYMLYGWAIPDLLTYDELKDIIGRLGFKEIAYRDVTKNILPSVKIAYRAGMFGMLGTKLYNLFKNGTHFSRVHYKTGLGQYPAYKKGLWEYGLWVFQKPLH